MKDMAFGKKGKQIRKTKYWHDNINKKREMAKYAQVINAQLKFFTTEKR